jgi:hypothetical protein
MVDVPIRTTKFLTITPSYLYYEVPPPSELNEASEFPGGVPETFREHQFRIDGTLRFSIRKFEIADRNMYVRRFLPTDDINRYRQRIGIAYPLAVNGRIWKPFANYEAFYDWRNGGWNKNRVGLAVTGAAPQARAVSAVLHLGEQSRGDRHLLLAVWTDCHHEIAPR